MRFSFIHVVSQMLNAKPLVYLSGDLHFLYAPIECLFQCKSEILLNRRVLLWL